MEDPAGEPGEARRRLPCRHSDRHGRRDHCPRSGPLGAQGGEVPVQQRRFLDAERGLARVGQSRRVRDRERFHRPAGKRGVHRPLRGPAGEDRGRCRQEGPHVQRGTHRTGRAGKRLGHYRESDRHDGRFEGVRPLADVGRPAAQEFPGLSSSLDSRGGKTMDRKKGKDRAVARQGTCLGRPGGGGEIRILRQWRRTGVGPHRDGEPQDGGTFRRERRGRADLRRSVQDLRRRTRIRARLDRGIGRRRPIIGVVQHGRSAVPFRSDYRPDRAARPSAARGVAVGVRQSRAAYRLRSAPARQGRAR